MALDGYLYAIGGNDGSTSLHSIERLNPKSNRWQMVSPMGFRRSSVAAVSLEVLKSKLFTRDKPTKEKS